MDSYIIFWACAVFGTTIIGIQLAMMMLGFGMSDFSGDVYHDVDSAGGTEDAFKVLSIQTIGSFLLAFGWGGLATTEQLGLSLTLGTIIALILGLIFVYLIKGLFKFAMSLNSTGAEYQLEELIGKKVSVYEKIPANGQGRIQASIGGMLREINAEAETDIPSGKTVEVVAVLSNSILKVR
jgi:membrane protein implicated in regulation of membrane protease activity